MDTNFNCKQQLNFGSTNFVLNYPKLQNNAFKFQCTIDNNYSWNIWNPMVMQW